MVSYNISIILITTILVVAILGLLLAHFLLSFVAVDKEQKKTGP